MRAERRSDASPRALWRWSGILAGGYSVTTDARRVWSGPAVTVGLSLGPLLALLSGAMHLVPEERTEVIVQDRARGTLEALSWTVRLTLGACLDLSPVKLCAGPAGTVWIRSARATGELYAARSGIDARPLFGGVLAPQLAVGAFLGALVAGCEVATSTAAVGVEGTGASLITPAWTCFASLSAGLRVP